jgi:uncharacterized membrane protein
MKIHLRWPPAGGATTLLGFLIVAIVGLRAAAQSPTNYTVTDLHTGPGFFSQATAINAVGQVLVSTSTQFLWSDGEFQPLIPPAGTVSLFVNGLSGGGELAGVLDGGAVRGRPGALLRLNTLIPSRWGTGGIAYAISQSGVVVGMAPKEVTVGSQVLVARRAARWTGRNPQELGTLGGREATALAVNSAGEAAGWSTTTGEAASHAVLWAGGMSRDLHASSQRKYSAAYAMNDHGVVVGELHDLLATTGLPFVWVNGEGMKPLPTTGYVRGTALGVNNHNQIVGALDGSAILWQDGKLFDLQNLISKSSGWDLDSAFAINDAGWIVGVGRTNGLQHAVLLRPVGFETNECQSPSLKVEILDPSTDLLDGDDLTSSPSRLGTGGTPAMALAADGAARVLLRFTATKHHELTVSLLPSEDAVGVSGDRSFDGALSLPGSAQRVDKLSLSLQAGAGTPQAFAVYHAPNNFTRPETDDGTDTARLVQLQVEVGTGPCREKRPLALMIVRPPVVVMHGIWSSRTEAFGGFETELRKWLPGVEVFGRDYPNDVHLATNDQVLRVTVDHARSSLARRQIVARRADVFAHSMGGVLSRIWAGNIVDYRRAENHGLGDFHKLVTIDSPHYGSFLADYLDRLAVDCFTSLPLLGDFMGGAGMAIDRGATADLKSSSGPILGMNLTPTVVPAHVMVGSYPLSTAGDEFESYLRLLGELTDYLGMVHGVKRIFCPGGFPEVNPPADTDLVVSFRSQAGGMPVKAMSRHEHMHTGAANFPDVAARAVELLNTATTSELFAAFPVGAVPNDGPLAKSEAARALPATSRSVGLLGLDAGAFQISSPSPGQLVTPGRPVLVTVDGPLDASLEALLVGGRGFASLQTNAPFSVQYLIPTNAVGPFRILAAARDSLNRLLRAEVEVNAQPASILDRLEVSPDEFDFRLPGVPLTLSVQGVYRDGVRRNLTAASTGTLYESDNTNVVTVDADGSLQPQGSGEATVTVRHGVRGTVHVRVALLPAADLGLTLEQTPGELWASMPAHFTFRLTNAGPAAAHFVTLRHGLQGGARWLSGTGADLFVEDNGYVKGVIQVLAPGESAQEEITLQFPEPGPYHLVWSVNSTDADATPGDNWKEIFVQVGPVPRLNVALREGKVVLLWDQGLTNYRLEGSPSATADAPWVEIDTTPLALGNTLEVAVEITDLARFFRLHRP